MLLLGAHLSIAKGFHHALLTAKKLKCNCVQIFVKNQRQWRAPAISSEAVSQWQATRQKLADDVLHVIGHSGYLINLASDSRTIRERSAQGLEDELVRCELLGIDRLVMHPGSHRGQGADQGIRWVADALDRILPRAPGVTVLLEVTCGAGHCLGGTIEELARLMDACRLGGRLGCCLDTCHLFAGGYDLATESALNRLMEKVDRQIGMEKIGCVHMNDSVGSLGSHLDRHAHIGKGRIGMEVFRYLLNVPELMGVPKVIETPKGAKGSLTFDRKNLSILRAMVERRA